MFVVPWVGQFEVHSWAADLWDSKDLVLLDRLEVERLVNVHCREGYRWLPLWCVSHYCER